MLFKRALLFNYLSILPALLHLATIDVFYYYTYIHGRNKFPKNCYFYKLKSMLATLMFLQAALIVYFGTYVVFNKDIFDKKSVFLDLYHTL